MSTFAPRSSRTSGEATETDFKRFADGTIIDLVRPSGTSRTKLIIYNKGKFKVRTRVEHNGRSWVPTRDAFVRSIQLPRKIAANTCDVSVDEILYRIATFLSKFVDFSFRPDPLAAAHYALSTWFTDRLRIAPILSIVGPTGSGKTQLARCLRLFCRRAVLFSDVNASTLRCIPMRLRPTLIMDEVEVTDDLMRILRAGTHRDGLTYYGGRAIDLFCPKVLITQKPLTDPALTSRTIQIHMVPSSKNMPQLTSSQLDKVETLIVPSIFRYFLENYDTVLKPDLDSSCLSPHKRDIALALAAPYNYAFNQQDIVKLLQPQDEDAIAERFFTRESAVLWALLWHFGNPECKYVLAGSIATTANELMTSRGERLRFTPKAVGGILRRLGFKPEWILDLGGGLWVTQDLIKMTHNLARHYGVIATQPTGVATPIQKENTANKVKGKDARE